MTVAQRSWWPVHSFVEAAVRQTDISSWPEAGTAAWCELADSDPAKWLAVLDAGQHWVLRLDAQQEARAEASRAVSAAADWGRVASQMRSRTEFFAAKPWLKRAAS
jgi:hypothetical protein